MPTPSLVKLLTVIVLPTCLLISSCVTQPVLAPTSVTPVLSKAGQAAASNDCIAKYPTGTSMYGDPNGVELTKDDRDLESIPEPELMGPAQILALDSKQYAQAYGIDHTEAMRQMLIQHQNEKQMEALQAEFGDRRLGMGFITKPEYGILMTLTGTGEAPPNRILYRPGEKLSERETVSQSYQKMISEGITLTQAEVDKAVELIESPTRFIVKFAVNPNAKNLTEAEAQLINKRTAELYKSMPIIASTGYSSEQGLLIIYVITTEIKAAGLTEQKLKQIGEEVMQIPIKIVSLESCPNEEKIA